MNALRNDGLSLKMVTALAATLAGAVLYTARIDPGWANHEREAPAVSAHRRPFPMDSVESRPQLGDPIESRTRRGGRRAT